MRKTEKFITSVATIAIGILLIVLKDRTIEVIASIFGVILVVLGVLDFLSREKRSGGIKCIVGALILAFGWWMASVVLYIVAVLLFLGAIWWLYELIRCRAACGFTPYSVFVYARPVILLAVGIFLLFHQGEAMEWIFIVSGVFTVLEGALLFADTIAGN